MSKDCLAVISIGQFDLGDGRVNGGEVSGDGHMRGGDCSGKRFNMVKNDLGLC